MKNLNESKYGFWGVLARKAKSVIEDENASQKFENSGRRQPQMFDSSTGGQVRFILHTQFMVFVQREKTRFSLYGFTLYCHFLDLFFIGWLCHLLIAGQHLIFRII